MRRSRVLDWALGHPFWVLLMFLGIEALLPVHLQATAWVCRGMIRAYQATVSPWLPGSCRFTPTCSHYGLVSIQRYGTLRGGALTAWRILRCSPLTRGGHDPVP